MPFFQQRGLAQARPGGRDVTVEGAFCMPGPDLRFFSLFRQLILFQVLLIHSFSLKSRYIPSLFLGSLYKITVRLVYMPLNLGSQAPETMLLVKPCPVYGLNTYCPPVCRRI